MDTMLEIEEAKYISLYCSDYVREMIDSAAHFREKKQKGKGKSGFESQQINDYHNSNFTGLRRDSHCMSSTLFLLDSGHESLNRTSNWQNGSPADNLRGFQDPGKGGEVVKIFQHPPTIRNFPTVHREQAFWNKDSQADFESEIKEKFALGKHRQKLLKLYGMQHFYQAYPKMTAQ